MTRFVVLPVVLFFVVAGLFLIGLFGNAPAALIAAMMCAGPAFMFTLGWGLSRASNEFALVKKPRLVEVSSANARVRRPEIREPLS